MTAVKEPQVFASADFASRLSVYESLLVASKRVRGESSAVYSQFPRWPAIPERISTVVPDARFLYLVRDPIDRLLAHYGQHVADAKERRDLSSALADLDRTDSLYVCPSRYATQLRRYLEHFPAESILVVDHDDLLERRRSALARIFGFLNVDDTAESAQFVELFNTSEAHRTSTPVGRQLEGTWALGLARRMPLPGLVRRPLRRAVSRRVRRPSLDDAQRAELVEMLREETDWLRGFTGQRFERWSL